MTLLDRVFPPDQCEDPTTDWGKATYGRRGDPDQPWLLSWTNREEPRPAASHLDLRLPRTRSRRRSHRCLAQRPTHHPVTDPPNLEALLRRRSGGLPGSGCGYGYDLTSLVTWCHYRGMVSLFGQVSLPPSDNPGPFAGVQSWLGDTLSGLMWLVVHIALPAAIVVAVGLGIWGAVSGNKQHMAQSRSSFGGIVGAVALGLIALAAATWLLSRA